MAGAAILNKMRCIERPADFIQKRMIRHSRSTVIAPAGGPNNRTAAKTNVSETVLDLGEQAAQGTRLKSCLSVPLLSGGTLLGVLTLYATDAGMFTNEHRDIAQTLCDRIAEMLDTRSEQRAMVRQQSGSWRPQATTTFSS